MASTAAAGVAYEAGSIATIICNDAGPMAEERPTSRARRTAVAAVASAAGIALLVWQVRKVGLETIRGDLAAVGLGFLAILATFPAALRRPVRGLDDADRQRAYR